MYYEYIKILVLLFSVIKIKTLVISYLNKKFVLIYKILKTKKIKKEDSQDYWRNSMNDISTKDEKYRDWESRNQFYIPRAYEYIAKSFGRDLMYNEVAEAYTQAVREVLNEKKVDVLSDISYGKGHLLARDKWKSMMTKLVKEKRESEETKMQTTIYGEDLFDSMRTSTRTATTSYKRTTTYNYLPKLPRPVDYKIINNKVVIVTFADGTTEKAVCDDRDTFDFERALEVIIMKKRLGRDYSQLVSGIVKDIKKIDKNKAEKEAFEKEQSEIIARRKTKAEKRKAKRLAAERETRIQEQAEAYARAMKMVNDAK